MSNQSHTPVVQVSAVQRRTFTYRAAAGTGLAALALAGGLAFSVPGIADAAPAQPVGMSQGSDQDPAAISPVDSDESEFDGDLICVSEEDVDGEDDLDGGPQVDSIEGLVDLGWIPESVMLEELENTLDKEGVSEEGIDDAMSELDEEADSIDGPMDLGWVPESVMLEELEGALGEDDVNDADVENLMESYDVDVNWELTEGEGQTCITVTSWEDEGDEDDDEVEVDTFGELSETNA